MAELRDEYPTVAVAHTMECAGNGRDYFEPETGSVQWTYGAVSTAFWIGTPVSRVFDEVGIQAPDGRWLTAVGGDEPAGDDVFARSIPLTKAFEDCILAYEVDGDPLPPEHGYPVRLLVPGWYGVNSVKWLDELRVTEGMVHGPEWADRDGKDYTRWQQRAYRLHPPGVEPTEHASIDIADTWEQWITGTVEHPYTFDQNVKSLIGRPDDGSTVTPREHGLVEVVGVAWAGDDRVETIEISTDGGETWTEGNFLGPDYLGAWRLFRFMWSPDAGEYTLVSRATDEHGRTQPARISPPIDDWTGVGPDEFPYNEGGYAENAYIPHAVSIEVEAP
jgi:DMSO/TMAO reductase YedYZ molybdopterin-dependent catalytic subunit